MCQVHTSLGGFTYLALHAKACCFITIRGLPPASFPPVPRACCGWWVLPLLPPGPEAYCGSLVPPPSPELASNKKVLDPLYGGDYRLIRGPRLLSMWWFSLENISRISPKIVSGIQNYSYVFPLRNTTRASRVLFSSSLSKRLLQ